MAGGHVNMATIRLRYRGAFGRRASAGGEVKITSGYFACGCASAGNRYNAFHLPMRESVEGMMFGLYDMLWVFRGVG